MAGLFLLPMHGAWGGIMHGDGAHRSTCTVRLLAVREPASPALQANMRHVSSISAAQGGPFSHSRLKPSSRLVCNDSTSTPVQAIMPGGEARDTVEHHLMRTQEAPNWRRRRFLSAFPSFGTTDPLATCKSQDPTSGLRTNRRRVQPLPPSG